MKIPTLTLTTSAIFGSQHAVTVDRHIAEMLVRVSSPTARHYDQAEALFRELAARFGWTKEMQADPWVAWNAQEVGMPAQGERPEALENHFGSAGGAVEQQKGVVARQKPIKVVLPHAEMELHPMGNVLSREEYYKLTRAVGLVEASSVMSHHGLGVGEVPPDDLAAVGGRVGEGSGSNVRFADQTSTADPTQFAQELAA